MSKLNTKEVVENLIDTFFHAGKISLDLRNNGLTKKIKSDNNEYLTVDEINSSMKKAAKGDLKGILDVNEKPLVSKDFNHNAHSSIFDLTQTQVIKGKFSRVLSWYDNEWGFSNRMCDTTIQIAGLI